MKPCYRGVRMLWPPMAHWTPHSTSQQRRVFRSQQGGTHGRCRRKPSSTCLMCQLFAPPVLQAGLPMAAYQVACQAPAATLLPNKKGHTPIDLAVASQKGEVLNAMLLACASHSSPEALAAIRLLLEKGAVPDTW